MRCEHWITAPLRAMVAVVLLAAALVPSARAHKASDAYLRVADAPAPEGAAGAGASVGLVLSVALKDVDAALEQLDANGDRQLTWGEVRQSMPAMAQWVGQGMLWQCDGTATAPAWRFEALEQRTDGRYARLAATLPCAPAQAVTLRYGLMQGIDPTHRLLVGGVLGGQPLAAVLARRLDGSYTLAISGKATIDITPHGLRVIDMVEGLDLDGGGIWGGDRGQRFQRRLGAVILHRDLVQQGGIGPAGADLGQVVLERRNRLVHFGFNCFRNCRWRCNC